MDVSTTPSIDLACPQAEADIEKYVHMFRDRGVDKIKYGHEGIMYISLIIMKHGLTLSGSLSQYVFFSCHNTLYDLYRQNSRARRRGRDGSRAMQGNGGSGAAV